MHIHLSVFSPLLSTLNAFFLFLSFYSFSLLHYLSFFYLSFLTTLPKQPNPR